MADGMYPRAEAASDMALNRLKEAPGPFACVAAGRAQELGDAAAFLLQLLVLFFRESFVVLNRLDQDLFLLASCGDIGLLPRQLLPGPGDIRDSAVELLPLLVNL